MTAVKTKIDNSQFLTAERNRLKVNQGKMIKINQLFELIH